MSRGLIVHICLILVAFLTACSSGGPSVDRTERSEMDSIVKECKDSVALYSLIHKFEKEGNVLGQDIAYRELGMVLREDNKFERAIEIHQKGISLAEQIGDTLNIVQHLNNIGTNFRRLGILDEAATYHYRALTYCEEQSDTCFQAKKNRVVSLNGIGNIQLSLGNDEAADSAFRAALHGEEELGSELGQAINYANLGSILEKAGKIDSARIYYEHSLNCNKKAGSDVGISLCHTHFGRLYENEKQWDKAANEYRLAYMTMEGSTDEWHWLEPCLALARVNISKGDNATAEEFLDKANEAARKINSMEHLEAICNLYYKLYDAQGNSPLALNWLAEANKYREEAAYDKASTHMQNVRVQYERERRQNELDLIKANYEAEHTSKLAFMLFGIAVAIIAVLLVGINHYIMHSRLAKQKLMQQMETVRTNFFTNITHEFRTPLTVILGLSKDISTGELKGTEEVGNAARVINSQGNGLLDLVNQLLDISKSQSQIGNPNWRHGNIIGYINMIVESVRPLASSKGIEMVYAPRENEVMMDFVPDYVTKIARNLLSNALKYTPKNGRLLIATHIDDSNLVVRLSDNGCGIPEDDLQHIFEPFYQASNSKTEIGTGIGLSLVKLLVDAMKGTIVAHSSVGKGTVFTITLPITHKVEVELADYNSPAPEAAISPVKQDAMNNPERAASPEIPDNPDSQEVSGTPHSNKNTTLQPRPIVLIVEDNPDVSAYMASILNKKYDIHTAFNGKEGLERAMNIVPDLIVTDVMMPEMDGTEMCRRIRESEITNHIPVIMVTARASEEDKIGGLEMGADAYLSKPFNAEELRIRVARLIEQRQLLREKYQRAAVATSQKAAEDDINVSDKQFLAKFTDFVYSATRKGEDIDTEAIAQHLCMSSRQLARKIQTLTGDNVISLVTKIRIQRAKQLMEQNKNMPLSEVAQKSGFADAAYFSRTFKQHEGITPTQYKRMQS